MTTGALSFARLFAGFEEHLRRIAWEHPGHYYPGPYSSRDLCALASWGLELVDRIAKGESAEEAIVSAMSTWERLNATHGEEEQRRRQAEQKATADRDAEEEITRTVDCPFCGQPAGETCRTSGKWRNPRLGSHRDRYRLARSLNDGANGRQGT